MRTLTITDETTGQPYHGHLPTGWHEVPLSAFLYFHQLQQQEPSTPAFYHLLAAVTGLPPHVLAEDLSIAAVLAPHLAFLHAGLPTDEPLPHFTHEGRTYTHTADFGRLSVADYTALLTQLDTVKDRQPVPAAARLLAVLYQPEGQPRTPDTLAATADAFQRLPLSLAWPAYRHLLLTWQETVLQKSRLHLAHTQAEVALDLTEQALLTPVTGPRHLAARAGRALLRAYLRAVRAHLTTVAR
ncbi:hypothetical protein FY528_08990 [Hymenobacter lutimineralis]|uniref:Uncharacterized protein n=1 Tax=Hymenobacter lutimineralis TaxID=2606448 RepID=A0A5D6V5R2_9BACT|nr:hypothetical protein [Hymenobacter lutimineralis]TYZ10587.1 hypothetical protein FY528_08990 [Hymenobacter lutimineralis]